MSLLSLRAYAKHRKVSLKAVQKAIETGRIRTVKDDNGRAKINPEDADRRWAALTDPSKQRGIPEPVGMTTSDGEDVDPDAMDDPQSGDYSASEAALGEKPPAYMLSKAMREAYLARIAKLNFRARAGELVEVKEIQAEWQKIVTTTKTRLLSVPSKVRSRIPHLTTGDMAVIEEEIRESLAELARGDLDGGSE